MIERSWKWAHEQKLIRKNPVHGEEEAKLVLEDFFSSSVELGESTNATADGAFEDYFTCMHMSYVTVTLRKTTCKTWHTYAYYI